MIKQLIKKYGHVFLRAYGKYYVKRQQEKYRKKGISNTRWFRYAFAECGDFLAINGNPLIHDPEKIRIGNHFTINNGAQICPRGNVVIGNYVTMSRGSQITAGMYDIANWKSLRLKGQVDHIEKDVFIGDGTWLCINSIVLPGVHITGKGVIVAAGAVVTSDITEDFVIVGGIPAKIIKYL